MNLKTFKKIAGQVAALEKADIKFDISITGDNSYQVDSSAASFEPVHFQVTTLKQLSEIQTILGRAIRLNDSYNKVEITGLKPVACVEPVRHITQTIKTTPANKMKYPTLKFHSDYARDEYWYDFVIEMISQAPTEQQEEDTTYRYIGDATNCLFCIPHTHELYNYLDKGFFYCRIKKGHEKERIVITNELTLDTYLSMLLCWLEPTYIKQLTNGCYINSNTAKLLRIKLEKDLPEYNKQHYLNVREHTLKEYEKSANSNLLNRVADGKIPHATYNNIRFTQNTATYETIKIEAEGLLNILQSYVVFDERTDIYTVIRDYIRYVIMKLEDEDLQVEAAKPVNTGDEEADKKAYEDYLAEISKEVVAEYAFKINEIPVVLKRTSENSRRYVNGITINKIEVEEVAFQCSCYDTEDEYNKFVRSVNKLSLKLHKALAQGVTVKISETLSYDEYKKPEAPSACPRIRFMREDEEFKVIIDKDQAVKVKFNECLKKLAQLNKQTNYHYIPGSYGRKDHRWAQRQLVEIFKECCTFDKKTITYEEVDEPVYVEEQVEGAPLAVKVQATNEDGTLKTKKVKKKNVTVTKECLLTDEQATFIGKMAEEFQKKAIEKSKVFLANAMKNTGATVVQFRGEEAYLIEGKMRKYAVMKRTNEVYNYENNSYICIVEPGHQISVGFDAVAARLYALKNDSFLVNKITTLKHG